MSEAVRTMFGQIAARYDRANVVLSMGQHQRWRRKLVAMSLAKPGDHVLDVATGTGDLAFLFRRRVGPHGRVVGVDFSPPMLDRARHKSSESRLHVDFQEADALRLPFPDATFDVASIAFGIRNVDDPAVCLREMARVTKPRGRVAVLEFGQPAGLLGPLFRLYSRRVLPRIGGRITGHRDAYEYLDRTAASFPSGEAFRTLMESVDRFDDIRQKKLTGGIVHAYVGRVVR